MKRYLIFITLLLSVGFASSIYGQLKIGVVTDTHYLSSSLMDNGYKIDEYEYNTGRNVKASAEILNKVFHDLTEQGINTLLVTGDLTKDGELKSHLDLLKKFKRMENKGIKIFVIPGNHDINMPNSLGYKGNTTYKTKNISTNDFKDLYNDFGYKEAIDKDIYSLSYVAELDAKTWLLAIDAARYEEYVNSSISGGRIKNETYKWIENTLADAKAKGVQVVAMMHWAITEHIALQASAFPNYLVADHQKIATLLADNGVKLIFTGHFHSHDITAYESKKGNTIYDISTGSLTSYPFAYRMVELDADKAKVKTFNIESTTSYPNLAENSKKRVREIAVETARKMLLSNSVLPAATSNEVSEQLVELLADIYILHLAGDEKLSDEFIKKYSSENAIPASDIEIMKTSIEFYPADNNLEILLK